MSANLRIKCRRMFPLIHQKSRKKAQGNRPVIGELEPDQRRPPALSRVTAPIYRIIFGHFRRPFLIYVVHSHSSTCNTVYVYLMLCLPGVLARQRTALGDASNGKHNIYRLYTGPRDGRELLHLSTCLPYHLTTLPKREPTSTQYSSTQQAIGQE
ncbi:hypothetical protein F5B21DRAFT_408398 [Xylaria acuta]|nr:hypothetical protein F5B21DRAFT_408398 [Xylaria acuta]